MWTECNGIKDQNILWDNKDMSANPIAYVNAQKRILEMRIPLFLATLRFARTQYFGGAHIAADCQLGNTR